MDEYGGGNTAGQTTSPQGTPRWALGIAFISAMVINTGVTAYLSVAPDIRSYISDQKETALADTASYGDSNKRLTEGLLRSLNTCTDQINSVSRELGASNSRHDECVRKALSYSEDTAKAKVEQVKCLNELALCGLKKLK